MRTSVPPTKTTQYVPASDGRLRTRVVRTDISAAYRERSSSAVVFLREANACRQRGTLVLNGVGEVLLVRRLKRA